MVMVRIEEIHKNLVINRIVIVPFLGLWSDSTVCRRVNWLLGEDYYPWPLTTGYVVRVLKNPKNQVYEELLYLGGLLIEKK